MAAAGELEGRSALAASLALDSLAWWAARCSWLAFCNKGFLSRVQIWSTKLDRQAISSADLDFFWLSWWSMAKLSRWLLL